MKFFLALFAVIAIAAAAPSSDESGNAPVANHPSPVEVEAAPACECNACSAGCVKQGYIGGLCYKDQCYCGEFM